MITRKKNNCNSLFVATDMTISLREHLRFQNTLTLTVDQILKFGPQLLSDLTMNSYICETILIDKHNCGILIL